MRNLFCYFTALIGLSLPAIASAKGVTKSAYQLQFEALAKSPTRVVTLYSEEALILDFGNESYQAVFVTIKNAKKNQICSYGANFMNESAIEVGNHLLQASYYCEEGVQFKPYDGEFWYKFRRSCGGEFCPAPAGGVGNLSISFVNSLNFARLPERLEVNFETDFTDF